VEETANLEPAFCLLPGDMVDHGDQIFFSLMAAQVI
jgi:hypothetical protein